MVIWNVLQHVGCKNKVIRLICNWKPLKVGAVVYVRSIEVSSLIAADLMCKPTAQKRLGCKVQHLGA